MTEENNDEYVFDPFFFQINAPNNETIKDFFMRSKFYETEGIDRDLIEVDVEKINDDYYLIYKKKRDNKNINISNSFAVYYWLKGKLFSAKNLKVILEAKINRINYYYDKINKKVTEALFEDFNNFQKPKKTIKLKKEFL